MLWFTVWSVLVIGALVVGYWLWRRLYRSAKTTMVEVNRGSELVAAVADRIDTLRSTAEPFVPRAGLSHDPVEARAHLAALRRDRAQRSARRRQAHGTTYGRWDSFGR